MHMRVYSHSVPKLHPAKKNTFHFVSLHLHTGIIFFGSCLITWMCTEASAWKTLASSLCDDDLPGAAGAERFARKGSSSASTRAQERNREQRELAMFLGQIVCANQLVGALIWICPWMESGPKQSKVGGNGDCLCLRFSVRIHVWCEYGPLPVNEDAAITNDATMIAARYILLLVGACRLNGMVVILPSLPSKIFKRRPTRFGKEWRYCCSLYVLWWRLCSDGATMASAPSQDQRGFWSPAKFSRQYDEEVCVQMDSWHKIMQTWVLSPNKRCAEGWAFSFMPFAWR